MRNLRFLFLGSLVAVGTVANASFDLMLIPGDDGRIYRHDPVNNISLGSYFGNVGNFIAVDGNGRSYSGSSTSNVNRVHNYSTGELYGSISTLGGTKAVEIHDGSLVAVIGSSIRKFSTTTGALQHNVTLASGVTWQSGARFGDVMQAIGLNTSNQVCFQSYNIVTQTLGALITAPFTVAVGTVLGRAATAQNTFTNTRHLAFSAMVPSSSMSLIQYTLAADGQLASTSAVAGALNNFSFSTSTAPALVSGHAGMWVVGNDLTNSALTRIMQLEVLSNGLLTGQTYTMTSYGGGLSTNPSGPFQPANVVAPEPGSMLALSLGAASLLRTRRKRS